jgi:hypothetical protein
VIYNTPNVNSNSSSPANTQSQLTGKAISVSAKAIASQLQQHQSAQTLQEVDSGGMLAMLSKFGNFKALPRLLTAIACPARVKRHNTSAWITGKISNTDYTLVHVPIAAIRSQHSIDGEAIEKTAQRASRILAWMKTNPTDKTIHLDAMNFLAGSTGALKIGCASADRLITLDGVGRLEAVRQAKVKYLKETGRPHPLEKIECYAARLKEDEYESLYRTSSYFRDEAGNQLDKPEHDLVPYSGLPRLVAGQALNLARHSIESSLPSFSDNFSRQIPDDYFSAPHVQT